MGVLVLASRVSSPSDTLASSTQLVPLLERQHPGAPRRPQVPAPTLTENMVSARPPAPQTPPPVPPPPAPQQQPPQQQPQPLLPPQRARCPQDLLQASPASSPSPMEAPPSQAAQNGFMAGSTKASCGAAPRSTPPAPM